MVGLRSLKFLRRVGIMSGVRDAGPTLGVASNGGVAAADELAAAAGAELLARGGNAVDAALGAAAAMAVVAPHMCGLGGDMFAVVKGTGGTPVALNGSGRAGSGADPERLRASGLAEMPFRRHVSSVTVPGCVAGWVALHQRFGSLALEEIFARACALARAGFPISPTLARASVGLEPDVRERAFLTTEPLRCGNRLALPRLAGVLDDVSDRGAAGFYEGRAGAELIDLGEGEFSEDDLEVARANWREPLVLHAFGHWLWTVPPNSQGYLTLAGAWIAQRLGMPEDPDDEKWAFTLIEAARQAASDRIAVLHEHAEGAALIAEHRLAPMAKNVRMVAARGLAEVYRDGGTTHICAVDGERAGVSLIMSNAADFGSHLTLPGTGIFLHNRGVGFSLRPGHPAEYGPGRRPPHTLSPLLATSADGALAAVMGTMGADAQPQILLQLLARMFVLGVAPGDAVAAPRWILSGTAATGFDTWSQGAPPEVWLEHGSPAGWATGLRERGYPVVQAAPGDQRFGQAQAIRVCEGGGLAGAADSRAGKGAFVDANQARLP